MLFGSWKLGIGSLPARLTKHALLIIVAGFVAACRQDMHDAPRYEPLEESAFFTDGRASRVLVANTVARGQQRDDEHLYTGKIGGQLATDREDLAKMPQDLDVASHRDFLRREERLDADGAHAGPPDADKSSVRQMRLQRLDQVRAEQITGRLSRDDPDDRRHANE